MAGTKLQGIGEKIANDQISDHFPIREFTKRDFPKSPTLLEQYLLNYIKKNLNIIREFIDSAIIITDCYRDLEKYNRLIEDGYNPSPTSDHFWGQPIPILRNRDQNKYGDYYTYSSGAVDFVVPKCDMKEVFNSIIELYKNNYIDIGQCILENNPKTGSEWIHFSNPKNVIYNNKIINAIGLSKYMFLKSNDNGKSYKAIEV